MAGLAQVGGLRMIGSFAGNTAGKPVVTAGAGAGLPCYPTVIKCDLRPIGDTGVTSVTRIIGWHMSGPFAHRNNIIVTIGAGLAGLIVRKRQHKIIPTRTGGMT